MPRVQSAGGIRFIEYVFPTARDARQFVKERALQGRYDLSARINVNPSANMPDTYKRSRGAVYVPIWSVEGEELRFLTRLLRKESEIVTRMTETKDVVLRVAEQTNPAWRLVADGTARRAKKLPKKPAKVEEI